MDLNLSTMSPVEFQRLAIAVVRYLLKANVEVIPFDPPYGVVDGGFDARVETNIGRIKGPFRLDAKRVSDYNSARAQLKDLLSRYRDLPVIFVIAARITDAQRAGLEELGSSASPRVKVIVYDGARLHQVIIDHPWLRDWFFSDRRASFLEPIRHPGIDDGVRPLLRTEQDALDEAIKQLAAADALIISGPSLANPERVLHVLGARAISLDRFDEAAWVSTTHREHLVSELKRVLGAEPARTLLLVRNPQVSRELLEGAHGSNFRLAIAANDEDVKTIQTRLRGAGSKVKHITLPAPSLAEIREFAISNGSGSGNEREAEHLALLFHLPDLITAWDKDPNLASLWIADRAEPLALEAASWIALLSDPDWRRVPEEMRNRLGRVTASALAQWIGGPESKWLEGIERAEKASLIKATSTSERAWLPVSEGAAALIVRAWYRDAQALSVDEAIRHLPIEIQADALANLSSMPAVDLPDRLLNLVRSLETVRQEQILQMRPEIWLAHADLLSHALRLATTRLQEDHESPLLGTVDVLALGALSHPQCISDSLALIASAGRAGLSSRYANRDVAGLTESILNPGQGMPGGYASEGFRWITNNIVRTGSPMDPVLLKMASAGLRLWLRRHIHWSSANQLTYSYGHYDWPQDPQIARGFSEVERLLSAIQDVGEEGWFASLEILSHAERQTEGGHPEQDKIIFSRMSAYLAFFNEAPSRERRAALEGLLNLALLHPALGELRLRWIAALSSDIIYRVWRFTVKGGSLRGPEILLSAYHQGGPQKLFGVEHVTSLQEIEVCLNGMVDSLFSVGASISTLRELLDSIRDAGIVRDTRLLVKWAQRDPEIFRQILSAEEWSSWTPPVRGALVAVFRGALQEDVRDLLSQRPSHLGGYSAALISFLDDPASVSEDLAQQWIEVLRSATWREPSLHILHTLALRCPYSHRSLLFDWWIFTVANLNTADVSVLDRILQALLDPPHSPLFLDQVFERLKRLDEQKKLSVLGTHRENYILDALVSFYRNPISDPTSLSGNYGIVWAVGRLLRRRPEQFWECEWNGWPSMNPFRLSVNPEEILAALRIAPELRDYHQKSAFDCLARHLDVAIVAQELRTGSPAQRKLEWLLASGMSVEFLDATEAMLRDLLDEDFDRARGVARRLANGTGNSGFAVGSAEIVPNFPDHPEPKQLDPISVEYRNRGISLGGRLGDLLVEMSEIYQHFSDRRPRRRAAPSSPVNKDKAEAPESVPLPDQESTPRKSAAKKPPAKKPPAAKKPAAAKEPAAAKKPPAKKPPAFKKSAAKKPPAKKPPAKKPPAKKVRQHAV